MRIGVIGIGEAGGRIADRFAYYNRKLIHVHQTIVPICLAINTAKSDLMGMEVLPMEDRILIGQTIVKGHGAGLNRQLGAEIVKDELHTIKRAIAEKGTHRVDAFLLVAGLGGGTGSGGLPLLAQGLKEFYSEPVYTLGILPGDEEGKVIAVNAAQCLLELPKVSDAIILFDNNLWRVHGRPIKESYESMNRELVEGFPTLLGAGEAMSVSKVGLKVIDASDIINTLKGLTVLGYSKINLPLRFRFFSRKSFSLGQLDPSSMCYSVIKSSIYGKLTTEVGIETAEKALVLVSGPPHMLSREGIERAKGWLEKLIPGAEVRAGDYPIPDSKCLDAVTMLSGIHQISAVETLLEKAKRFEEEMALKRKTKLKLDEMMGSS